MAGDGRYVPPLVVRRRGARFVKFGGLPAWECIKSGVVVVCG